MTMFLQNILNIFALRGVWILSIFIAISIVAIWYQWHHNQSLSMKARIKRVAFNGWGSGLFILSVVGIYLIKVQCAPLFDTLATLNIAKNESLPDISFRRVDDDTIHHLHEFEGKVVVLNLWATWCPPCLKEMPTLDQLQSSYKDRGLVVITLSDEPRERLQAYFERHSLELLSGYTSSFEWLKIKNFRPLTLFIDRNGVLRQHVFGELSYANFESIIQPFL